MVVALSRSASRLKPSWWHPSRLVSLKTTSLRVDYWKNRNLLLYLKKCRKFQEVTLTIVENMDSIGTRFTDSVWTGTPESSLTAVNGEIGDPINNKSNFN